jgi:hypothetical protein
MSNLNVTLDKIITYTDPNLPKGKVTFIGTSPPKPTAEQMLKKALEFSHTNIDGLLLYYHELNEFDRGMLQGYRYMAAHLEMLIKETKQ